MIKIMVINHVVNDDNDLFTSHDQEEKEGAGGGLQFSNMTCRSEGC